MEPLLSPRVWEIASALKLSVSGSPSDAVLRYCERRAEEMLVDFPDCANPTELLEIMAAILGTTFEEVHTDEELLAIQQKYYKLREFGVASLDKDLEGQAYGVTYRRMAAATGQRAFVSVIDCRSNKALKAYFTKWHELGHLLILTDPQRASFRRTHVAPTLKDPEESLVDLIAGQLGFHPRFLLPEIGPTPSFEEVERIRIKLFPEASFQASANAITKNHSARCLLIEAKPDYKKREQLELMQGSLGFFPPPTPKLRVQSSIGSESARTQKFHIPKSFRVPASSIIHQVFDTAADYGRADECLSLWESGGKHLNAMSIRVEVRRHFDSVLALIVPLDDSL